MSPYYVIRLDGDRYRVGVTTDGTDFAPIPSGAFGTPREAIRYAEMRQLQVSPLRAPVVDPVSLPGSTAGSLTRP